ncbi:MAG: hypothetical protein K6L81_09380 [Agarilytica sp.]
MNIKHTIEAFIVEHGRRPRMLVCALTDTEECDRGAKMMATGFADIGFDIDLSPSAIDMSGLVRQAIENDVHVIGVNALACALETHVPLLIEALADEDADDIAVVVGGELSDADRLALGRAGARGFWGQHSDISLVATEVLAAVSAGH